ncbi:diguanylate cyclase domain-containing protein [Vibrio ostreicida]|uniref:diguanylate cyclase n=1 Tax=Vibrio ostreicida TaxID=526588 RepID=A0ABT8BYF6_9VIBR|nr:diguanylate cyclase [Vibrio ostreicida]MDN3611724.1 diguanylate cyclase [Vibrio ostreicida]
MISTIVLYFCPIYFILGYQTLVYPLRNFSLRQLTILVSLSVVMLFLLLYFAFKALWSHDIALTISKNRQQFEVERVKTVLKMEALELRASLEDYAAWTTLANYVEHPNNRFIEESIGPHAFQSKFVDSIVILDKHLNVQWDGSLDHSQVTSNQNILSLQDPDVVQRLIYNVKHSANSSINSYLEYTADQGNAYMVTSAPICLSDGKNCNFGYLIFIRKIRQSFIAEIEAATGVTIHIIPTSEHAHLDNENKDNVTLIHKNDFLDQDKVVIEIIHNEQLPNFLTCSEASVLTFFSLIMFFLNLLVVSRLIKPLTQAQQELRQFQKSGDRLPNEASFISKEMRSFARDINNLINELEEKRSILKKQSTLDPLTGIANRRHLYETANHFINQLKYRHVSVVLIDVDHFKQYNDHYGHIAGDAVLKQVTQALSEVETDYEHLVCRYGGEEFCILLASDVKPDLDDYVNRLILAVRGKAIEHAYSSTSDTVTISAGASYKPSASYDCLSGLFQLADEALYQAKNNGRDRYNLAV